MKQTFDFDTVGKRMPYTVPQAYFDTLSDRLIAQVATRNTALVRTKRRRLWGTLGIGLTTAAVVILAIVFRGNDTSTTDYRLFDQTFANLTEADQDYLLTLYDDMLLAESDYPEEDTFYQ